MDDPNVCEVCNHYTNEEYLDGCELCGRMYASCCNSEQDGVCVGCA